VHPTLGRIVHYRLSTADVEQINDRNPSHRGTRQIRNHVEAGQVLPAVVVATFGSVSTANLKVLLDGEECYWATSRTKGDGDGLWFWPPRA
jgi:hypothetical protein